VSGPYGGNTFDRFDWELSGVFGKTAKRLSRGRRALGRWQVIWGAFFYVVMAYALWVSLSDGSDSGGQVALQLGVAAALSIWYAYWAVIRAGSSRDVVFLLGAAGLWAALSAFDPDFLILGAAIFAPLCLHDQRWAGVGAVVVGGGWIWMLWTDEGRIPWQAVFVVLLFLATWVLSAAYVSMIMRQSRERQRLIEELRAAQAELAEAERQAGVLEERQRLARDIHDTLTQGFASIVMLLEAVEASLEPGHRAARNIAQALRSARDNLAESRRLVWALRPEALSDTPLPVALDRLARSLSEETGIHAETVVTGTARTLDGHLETILLRAAQESLANVRKHARATAVTITLSYMDDVTVLDVQDDGVGFSQSHSAGGDGSRGLGLRAMRERVEEAGGTVSVESHRGEGTTVVVSVPLSTQRSVEAKAPSHAS
jgi:signal transduction histidine kinase